MKVTCELLERSMLGSSSQVFLPSQHAKSLIYSYTIPGLEPFTEYDIRVSAVNDLGEGSKSEPVYVMTGEARMSLPTYAFYSCTNLACESTAGFIFDKVACEAQLVFRHWGFKL